MNRKERRASKAKGKSGALMKAVSDAQRAINQLESTKLEELPLILRSLKEQTHRAATLADALVTDYETLLQRLEVVEAKLGITQPSSEPDGI